jgi:GAF domain-containing protein
MAANWPIDSNLGDMSRRLSFFKNLQRVTNKIHGASNIDEIILEMSEDICELFHCDRLTIYLSATTGRASSRSEDGAQFAQGHPLPISEQSVAGYVAASGKSVNIRDVYDEANWRSTVRASVSEGGRRADRLSLEADAGGADQSTRRTASCWASCN